MPDRLHGGDQGLHPDEPCRHARVQARMQDELPVGEERLPDGPRRCTAVCPPSPPSPCDGAFSDACGRQLATCARSVLAEVKTCNQGCGAAADRLSCLQDCAENTRTDAARCASGFDDCIAPCGPPATTTTTLPGSGCIVDADCADGNPCTADACAGGTCNYACLCVDAAGASTCCPGPSTLCIQPCGVDPAGNCGGLCPAGADTKVR